MGADGFVLNHAFCAEPLRAASFHQSLPQPLRLFMTFICVLFPDGGVRKHTSSSFDCVRLRELHQIMFPGIFYTPQDFFLSCVSTADDQTKIACVKILGPSPSSHQKVNFTALRVLGVCSFLSTG